MIDPISNTSIFSALWQYIGPLVGVGFGYLIADKVWDRQKQWEMRRDAVFEVVRALGELQYALIELHSVHSRPIPENEDMKLYVMNEIRDKAKSLDMCNAKFYCSMFLARMVVGKELHKTLTESVNEIRSISRKILSTDSAYYMRSESDTSPRNPVEFNAEALMEKTIAAIFSARKALKIAITD